MKLFDVYPLFNITLAKAKGSYVWDTNGQKYLDLYGGHAVISIGHTHPHYVNAIREQLDEIGFYSNSIHIPMQQQLAGMLGKASGYNDYQLFLCNSGAEANENALKLASFHNGKKKIIAFNKSFHGRTSLAVASTDDKKIVAPVNETPNIHFLPLNDESAIEQAIDNDTCAVIVEGIQGVGGINVPTDSFLKKLRTLCDKHNAVLILDEVQSGYGRTGKFFAHQHSGVQADIITVAKGMGNGFPIGGILISPKIEAKHNMLGTTFGGAYLACAAAIAVLEVIEKEELLHNAKSMGDYLVKELKQIAGVKEVRGTGLMLGIELDMPFADVRKELLDTHHIFTGSSGNENTLRLLPALNVSKTEADIFLDAFKKVMAKTVANNPVGELQVNTK